MTAIEYYEQALLGFQEVGYKAGEGATLSNLGLVYEVLGEPEKAISYYEQSLEIRRLVGDKRGEGRTLDNLGLVYYGLGEPKQAISYFQQSLEILRQVGDKAGEGLSLYNIAFFQRQQGNLLDAKTNIEAAIEIIENIRGQLISPDLRTSYFASVNDYYQFYIDLLMELDQLNPNSGYNILAFNASEKSRTRTLIELLTESGANIREGVAPELLAQENAIFAQLKVIETERQELFSTNSSSNEAITKLKQDEANLYEELARVQNQIRATSPRYADITQPQPLTLEEIQAKILDEQTVLLQYSLGEENSYLWVVTKDSFTSLTLPQTATIQQAANNLRDKITNDQLIVDFPEIAIKETNEANTQLSELILPPDIFTSLSDKTKIIVVPDGVLNYLPFNLLFVPESQEFLFTQYEIVYNPSSSTIDSLRKFAVSEEKAPLQIAITADAVFSPNDDRLNGGKGKGKREKGSN